MRYLHITNYKRNINALHRYMKDHFSIHKNEFMRNSIKIFLIIKKKKEVEFEIIYNNLIIFQSI